MSGDWKPVSEEMPDMDRTVIIYSEPDDNPVWLGFHNGLYWCCLSGGELLHQPTHWMEMPEPPVKEGGSAS